MNYVELEVMKVHLTGQYFTFQELCHDLFGLKSQGLDQV